MDEKKKDLGVFKGLLILLALGILGLAGWKIWGDTKPDSPSSYSAACSATAQTTNNSQLSNGWSWYEIRGIGLKYAYPNSWGTPTTQTNSGTSRYEASFTASPSGANTMVSLNPDCSDFRSNLSNINNDKFDVLSGSTITKAIKHDGSSYSSLSHWTSDSGNQYKLATYRVVSAGNINTVEVDYSVVSGSEVCPDDKLASADQPKCINQSISDVVDQVIGSLQKI